MSRILSTNCTPPIAPLSWPRFSASAPSAMPVFATTSRRSAATRFALDPDKVEERKFDGVFVQRTNTDLHPARIVIAAQLLQETGLLKRGIK
jgi:hypothetical protein